MNPQNLSLAESMRLLSLERRETITRQMTPADRKRLHHEWRFWGRPKQLLPGTPRAEIQRHDWLFWVVDAGRGFGKTRTGAETIREWAEEPKQRILLIAPTASDVREVMLEGPSGLLNCYPPDRRPEYNPSRHLLRFPSGAIGFTRSADEPERLRGPQFTKFWADELCAWNFAPEAWEQIMFGLRLPSARIQGIVTTTPKPLKVFKEILAGANTVVTHGSSYENRANLSQLFFDNVIKPYEGTRIGRQEINAEMLDDTPGALWTRSNIDAYRIDFATIRWDLLQRIVVAIDPAVTSGENSDETGIVAVGRTVSGHAVVIEDGSCKESPAKWAEIGVGMLKRLRGDRIIGEVNNGGDLVERNIRVIDGTAPFRAVRASRGKLTRAEPVAAMYERGLVHHAGKFTELEDEMCTWVLGMKSPSRMDALVWAITELFIDTEPGYIQVQFGQGYEISPI